ncbi:MAG: orotate phosphoribosyltransferase [Deltaproteobacteria bacterium]|nr:orotate phosphoribosyltransferase [Deltaproteobacteria bacterium]
MSNLHQLKEILLKLSYEKREVRLASGRVSDFYFDGKQTTLNAEGSLYVGKCFFDLFKKSGRRIQAVGGPTLGADPIVTAISVVSALYQDPIPAFIVRKEPKKHGTAAWIEGMKNLKSGMQVALVEDVVTSGGSILKAAEKVEQAGFSISLIATIVDREEGGAEIIRAAGYRFASLFTKSELLS